MQNQKLRGLIDSGAEVSLLNNRVYQQLKDRPKLIRKPVNLQDVNGKGIKVEGVVTTSFTIGKVTCSHNFYVVTGIRRNLILGQDWLVKEGVRLYYDLGCLRVKGTYAPLEDDIHVASLLRLTDNKVIKPQTASVCVGKFKARAGLKGSELCEISAVNLGDISNEPGVMVSSSITKTTTNRKVPVFIVNNTNKTLQLKRGSIIGKVGPLSHKNVHDINNIKSDRPEHTGSDSTNDLSVPTENLEVIQNLLAENRDLFAEKDIDLSHTETVRMKIDTGTHPPIRMRPYRTPLTQRATMDKTVDDMLQAGIISRSKSPWAFPVVLVDKKDGSKRFCVDFRALNKITKTNSYPLPLIDDVLSLLGRAKYFTTLDLKSGYWQVLMEESDKEKVSFSCHRGLFQFNVMPFGLANAPAVFQELMAEVLQNLEGFAIAYLDDILIYSETEAEHSAHIQEVFARLRKHQLKLKLKKCQFFKKETKYLGFVINQDGVKPDPDKVKAVRLMAAPISVKEVRAFVGMCSYYRRFLPNFSRIAEPLIALTRKYAKFQWSQRCQLAFDQLKDNLTIVPQLAYPDINKPYVLYTDASDTCIGACLTQPCEDGENILPNVRNEKPIYYLSHKLSDTQTRWSTIEKEAFAIHYALQKLDHFLHNAKFTIKTDHKPLKYLLDSPMQNRKIQLWALGIAGYDCEVQYIKGSDNTCADLLSRSPLKEHQVNDDFTPDLSDKAFEVNALNSNQFDPNQFASCKVDHPTLNVPNSTELTLGNIDMAVEQQKDIEIVRLRRQLEEKKSSRSVQSKYLVIDDVLHYISNPDVDPVVRLYVPDQLRSRVVTQYHDDNGHMGIDKTFDAIRAKYFWPSMYKQLYEYVSSCVPCQRRSSRKTHPPLQQTDIPPYPFAKIGLDLSGPYPESLSGNKYIISFVDLYSGWPEAFAVPDKSAGNVVHLLIDEIVPRFGCPLQIITDNGTENINRVMKETLETLNISHVTTSYYHPQSNAKVERFHRTLHDVLAKKLENDTSTWDIYLNQTLAAVRYNINESSRFSPFFLLYNRDVVLPIDNLLKPHRRYLGEEPHKIALEKQHQSFVLVHRQLKKAKRKQAKYADKNSKEVTLQVGDPVYVKNHLRKSKLHDKWRPYYRIVEKRGPVTFIIKNQLDGTSTKSHAEHLRLADIDDWEIPTGNLGRPVRKPLFVVPPENGSDTETSVDEEELPPLRRIANKFRRERETSSDEENIPLMELAKRLREKQSRLQNKQTIDELENDIKTSDDETRDKTQDDSSDYMSIDEDGDHIN